MSVREFRNKREKKAADNLDKLVRSACELEPQFNSDTWTFKTDKPGSRGNDNFYFRQAVSIRDQISAQAIPWPEPYNRFAKAHIAHRRVRGGVSHGTLKRDATALRWLFEVVGSRDSLHIDQICAADFQAAEKLAVDLGVGTEAVAALGVGLANIVKTLNHERLTAEFIDFQPNYRGTRGTDVFSQEARARAKNLLPNADAFAALGSLRKSATSDFDRLMFAILDLLFATGCRISEILMCSVDCLGWKSEYDPGSGKRVRVRVFRSPIVKNGRRVAKPLSPEQAEHAEQAIKTILELTQEARTLARWLEKHPGRLRGEANWGNEQFLTNRDVKSFMGSRPPSVDNAQINNRAVLTLLGLRIKGAPKKIKAAALVDALLKRMQSECASREPQIKKGAPQLLSQWLLLEISPYTGRQLVQPVAYSRVVYFLSNPIYSVFTRHDMPHLKLASHAMRRVLHTAAKEGGISDLELAKYFGRASPQQNAAYDFRAPRERAEQIRDAIRDGQAFGPISAAYWRLPVSERELFLSTFVTTALRVLGGFCLHNHGAEPCPYFLQCLRGCGKFMVLPGDPQNEEGLTEQLINMTSILDELDVPWRNHPKPELLGPWVANLIKQVGFAEEALATVRYGEGPMTPVRPDAEQIFRKVNARRGD